MNSMKYPPASFLELDDLAGGRKVVLVGKDGVTFWDDVQTDRVTPLLIHPVLKPLALGSLVQFVQQHALSEPAHRLLAVLAGRDDARAHDALFVMRSLWHLHAHPGPADSLADRIAAAFEHAGLQQARALRLHVHAEQFHAASAE